jgi:pyroglutamyl-peptidase
MARSRVLLTGFGPYPGVAENPSGWLAETLATRNSRDCNLHAHVLPTEWKAVDALTPRLHESVQPRVMIHFGVSPRAKTLRIEHSAYNRTASRADERGAFADTRAISPGGAMRLDTGLPVTRIAAHLRAQGIAAHSSRSCGRYLCNFLYYRSLQLAQDHRSDALFVHVPHPVSQDDPFSADALVHASEEILRFVLDVTTGQETRPAQNLRASHSEELRQ